MKTPRRAVCRTPPRPHQFVAAACCLLAAVLWPSGRAAAEPAPTELPAPSAGEPGGLLALPLDALLDMEVTGPSRFAQRASESAASVTVVTAAEIRALGLRSLAEVLQTMRGLNVLDDRTYANLGVRGFSTPGNYSNRVLVLINGNRVNDPVYGQAYIAGEFPLDIDLIERVEFIPGQGSSVYGGNALFGVVNVITRKPSSDEARWVLAYGSGHARETRLGLSRSVGADTRLSISASRRVSDGLAVVSPSGEETASGVDYERRTHLLVQAEHGPFSMTLIGSDRFKGIPSALGLAFGDPASHNRDRHVLLDLLYDPALDAGSRWTTRFYVGRYTFRGQYRYELPEVPLNVDDTEARWGGVETRWLITRWQGHKLLLGAELLRNWRLRQSNRDIEGERTIYFDQTSDETRMALHAEDQFELAPQWTLIGGARHDRLRGGLTRFSPRVALNYRPDASRVFKLIHAVAYREPNAFEAHYESDSAGGFISNPALREEVERGTEFAFDWQLDPTSRLSGSAFVNQTHRLVSMTYDPAIDRYSFFNTAPLESRGLELEYERIWRGGARLRANVSVQSSQDLPDFPLSGFFPRRMAKLGGVLPLSDDWTVGVTAQAVSRRLLAGGHGNVDLNVSRYFGHQGSVLSFGLYNLANRRHPDPGADSLYQPVRLQDGLTFRLRLELAL